MMKMYAFVIDGTDCGGWVVAENEQKAKSNISAEYGQNVQQITRLNEILPDNDLLRNLLSTAKPGAKIVDTSLFASL